MKEQKQQAPETIAQQIVYFLEEAGLTCATAESCTGGLIAAFITAFPGASQVFLGGAVTYTNQMKQTILGVKEETLRDYTAVSAQTAAEMAMGVCKLTGAAIGVSATGNAGPAPSEGQPVGLVFVGVHSAWHSSVITLQLDGMPREEIRAHAVATALQMILDTAGMKKS